MVFSDRVLSITQDGYVPKVVDNLLNDNIFLYRQISNGKAWYGERLKIPLMLSKNTNGTSYSGLTALPASPVETRVVMYYDPRAYAQGITVAGLERDVNSISDTQVLSLIEAEMEIAQNSMSDSLGDIFYGDGTGNASQDFNGADNLNDDGTTATNVGNLSRTTYTQLKSTRTSFSAGLTLARMSTLLTAATGGSSLKQSPTIIISDMTVWDLAESLLQPAVRTNYDANGFPLISREGSAPKNQTAFRGSGGFQAIYYRGIPWIKDQKATASTIWVFNERYLDWYGIKSTNPKKKSVTFKNSVVEGVYDDIPQGSTGFMMRDWMTSYNQDAESMYLFLEGNLTTSQPRRHARATSVTAV